MTTLTRKPVPPLDDAERQRVRQAVELADEASEVLEINGTRSAVRHAKAQLRKALVYLDGVECAGGDDE